MAEEVEGEGVAGVVACAQRRRGQQWAAVVGAGEEAAGEEGVGVAMAEWLCPCPQ